MDNPWFNIDNKGATRNIKLLVVHYGPSEGWMQEVVKNMPKEDQERLKKFIEENKKELDKSKNREDVATDSMFPNFILTETHMAPLYMNLLAHLTSHVCSQQMPHFKAMFA